MEAQELVETNGIVGGYHANDATVPMVSRIAI
jgi:hypothetical protein